MAKKFVGSVEVGPKKFKPAGTRTRFMFGREMSEDDMIDAIHALCDDAGIEFIPERKGGPKLSKRTGGE